MTTQPTATQALVLSAAARRADMRVISPDTLRGGARIKVITALLKRGWIVPADGGHLLTDAGYTSIGQQRPEPPYDVQPVDTIGDLQLLEGLPVRPGTKLTAMVIALRRPQGAASLQLIPAKNGFSRKVSTMETVKPLKNRPASPTEKHSARNQGRYCFSIGLAVANRFPRWTKDSVFL